MEHEAQSRVDPQSIESNERVGVVAVRFLREGSNVFLTDNYFAKLYSILPNREIALSIVASIKLVECVPATLTREQMETI